MNLTDKQKNRVRRLRLASDEGALGLVGELNDIEEKIDLAVKGDRGDDGDDGKDGVDGRDGSDGRDGRDGKDGLKGRDGKDGVNGRDGVNGVNGKDGSPDTPEEVVEKVNLSSTKIRRNKVEGLDEMEKNIDDKLQRFRGGTIFGGRGVHLYTDSIKRGLANTLNIKAGTGVTITYDHANGQNNVTFSATGGGVVDSVNGQTGVVVLDAADVGADPAGSAATAESNANAYTDTQIAGITGGYTVETPSGTVDGSNTTFTVSAVPVYIVVDGITLFDGAGYTIATLTLTLDNAPQQFIRSFH